VCDRLPRPYDERNAEQRLLLNARVREIVSPTMYASVSPFSSGREKR
jgi:hypothetical protein